MLRRLQREFYIVSPHLEIIGTHISISKYLFGYLKKIYDIHMNKFKFSILTRPRRSGGERSSGINLSSFDN